MSALELRAVQKRFGATVALRSLDLALVPGELVSLLGPSGCGKTTALRIAAGFEAPDEGVVTIADAEVTALSPDRRNTGMVFQNYSLFPHLTVEDNIGFGMRMRRLADGAGRRRRAAELLDLVGLPEVGRRYPHQLSGGQQQRIALARALATQPKVLLLDEPLSALDAKVRVQLREEIRRIQRDLGITTLFVTHDQEEALAISDRVGVMSQGVLEQLASPRDVYEHPASSFVARFVGRANEVHVVASGGAAMIGAQMIGALPQGLRQRSGPVTLLVRPEHIRVVLDGSAGDLGATVVSHSFAGSRTVVVAAVDGLRNPIEIDLASDSAEATGAQPGRMIGVRINLERAVAD